MINKTIKEIKEEQWKIYSEWKKTVVEQSMEGKEFDRNFYQCIKKLSKYNLNPEIYNYDQTERDDEIIMDKEMVIKEIMNQFKTFMGEKKYYFEKTNHILTFEKKELEDIIK